MLIYRDPATGWLYRVSPQPENGIYAMQYRDPANSVVWKPDITWNTNAVYRDREHLQESLEARAKRDGWELVSGSDDHDDTESVPEICRDCLCWKCVNKDCDLICDHSAREVHASAATNTFHEKRSVHCAKINLPGMGMLLRPRPGVLCRSQRKHRPPRRMQTPCRPPTALRMLAVRHKACPLLGLPLWKRSRRPRPLTTPGWTIRRCPIFIWLNGSTLAVRRWPR